MALLTCPECQTKMSDTAAACPKCGAVLTEEQKAKIIDDEKKTQKKSQTVGLILAGVFLLAFVTCMVAGASSKPSSSASTSKDLSAQVTWSSTQFKITNNDSFDWTNVRIRVNSKYTLTTNTMTAGETYTVGMAQFADDSGNRFNPFQTKVLNIFIGAKQGTYYGEPK
jgi:transcription initiation factor TFIIIB Brf1 subunit/transcription initiation factor TFIIB